MGSLAIKILRLSVWGSLTLCCVFCTCCACLSFHAVVAPLHILDISVIEMIVHSRVYVYACICVRVRDMYIYTYIYAMMSAHQDAFYVCMYVCMYECMHVCSVM